MFTTVNAIDATTQACLSLNVCTWFQEGAHLRSVSTVRVLPLPPPLSLWLFCLFVNPPKDGEIALWSPTNRWYVVNCVSQKRNQSNIKVQWYNILSILYLNSTSVEMRLKHVYSVISVKIDSQPDNTKIRESTRS